MTELILKPQNSTGWLYTITGNFVEFVADGNNFSGYVTTSAYNVVATTNMTSEEVIDAALTGQPGIGSWQSYYQSGVGSSSVPATTGQPKNSTELGITSYTGINLCSPTIDLDGGNNGLYQQVYGLTPGNDYELSMDYLSGTIDSNSALSLHVYDSNGTLINDEYVQGAIGASNNLVNGFTATTSEITIVVNFFSLVAECVIITNVSLLETWSTVNYSLSDFTDGSVSLDLFEESIPLTLSVSEFTNAVENVQSYSKDFKLPSTKKNDKVFSHIYNLDSTVAGDSSAFNPYVKTIATIKENNVEIFTGELTLNSIDKGSEGITYDVHLQSIVTGLASALKGKDFNALNMSELKHDFTRTNIKDSWYGGVLLANDLEPGSPARDRIDSDRTGVVKYPFVNWIGTIEDPGNTGNLLLNKLEDVYRPWLSAKYLLDKIFKAANFSYDSNFLNSPAFTNLYMDFNHGSENGASASASSGDRIQADWHPGTTPRWMTDDWTRIKMSGAKTGSGYNVPLTDDLFDYANGSITPLVDNTSMRIVTQIMLYNETNTAKKVDVRLVKESFNGIREALAFETIKISGSPFLDPHGTFAVSVNTTLVLGDKVYVEAKTHKSTSNIVRQGISGNDDDDSTWIKIQNYGSDAVDFETILDESRGEVPQWDYIKSLMNMFNLIIMPTDNPNRLRIEPYDDIFGQLTTSDITSDPFFEESTKVDESFTDSGLTSAIMSIDRFQLSASGTQSQTYNGFHTVNFDLIDGERYDLEVDVDKLTGTGTAVTFQVMNHPYYAASLSMYGEGKKSTSFIFDKSANAGSNSVKIRMSMPYGTTQSYYTILNSMRLVGKKVNTSINKKDWTHKIDEDTFRINMQDLDSKVDFSFLKDEDDYSATVYSNATRDADGTTYRYGNLNYSASEYTSLTSTSSVDVDVIASTIVKPLNDYAGLEDLIVPSIYKSNDENEFSVYANEPRLLYNNGVKSFPGSYTSPQQNGDTGFSSETEYLQFTHFSTFDNTYGASPSSLDYNFRNCPSLVSNGSVNGLFNEYWSTYYNEKYHPDTRMYEVNALLSPDDISNFEYTDIIRIKNQEFRINNIQYTPTGMSKINLIKLP